MTSGWLKEVVECYGVHEIAYKKEQREYTYYEIEATDYGKLDNKER